MGLSISNRQLLIYGLVILLIGAVIGSVSLTYPFGRDQAIFAYAGKLLLEGKMNYLHVFDLKPPGIHFLFAFIQFISGESMLGARIFDIIWQSATAFLILLLAYRLTEEKLLSVVASFFYVFLYFRQDYWHTLQTDGSLNLFFVLSILLLILNNNSHSFIRIFLGGVLFAAALLFKYTIISFLPLLFIAFLLDRKYVFSLRVKNILVYTLGIVLVSGIIVLLYYITGALNAFYDIQFIQTPLYTKIAYETESAKYVWDQVLKLFTYSVYSPLIFLSLFGMIYILYKKKIAFVNLVIFFWIIASLFSLIVQWKFYYYHFLVIIPSLTIGSVYGLSIIKSVFKRKPNFYRVTFAAFITGLVVFGFKPYIQNYDTLYSFVTGKETLNDVYIKNGFTSDSVFMISKTFRAIDVVKQETKIDDGIYVWGFDPLIYYLSDRKCVSRFIYNFPLLWKAENSEFRREFMVEIVKKNPKLIVVAQSDPLLFISGYNEDSKQLLNRFPEFYSFISDKYYLKTTAGDYEIYEQKTW